MDVSPLKNELVHESSEHLFTGLFTPGDKQVVAANDQMSPQELLVKNEQLLAQIHAQAERLGTAYANVLKTVPVDFHASFLEGISCFNDPHDVVYNNFRQQFTTIET